MKRVGHRPIVPLVTALSPSYCHTLDPYAHTASGEWSAWLPILQINSSKQLDVGIVQR